MDYHITTKDFNPDGTLTEATKSILVARMRVKYREALSKVNFNTLRVGDKVSLQTQLIIEEIPPTGANHES